MHQEGAIMNNQESMFLRIKQRSEFIFSTVKTINTLAA